MYGDATSYYYKDIIVVPTVAKNGCGSMCTLTNLLVLHCTAVTFTALLCPFSITRSRY